MTELETLDETTTQITHCSALVVETETQLPVFCDAVLKVISTKTVRGDDYGSFKRYDVYFECGHSFKDMVSGLQNSEFI